MKFPIRSHLIHRSPAWCVVLLAAAFARAESPPIVIAHRGASGYLPEHTLAAKAMAYAMGADYLEQDVVLTRDDVPIVLHDVHLDTVTNVAQVYPDRARSDGRFYAIDFDWVDVQRLQVNERIDLKTGRPVYGRRFPVGKSACSIPTLAAEIELIQGLNRSTGRQVGVYTEIKAPSWHRKQGKDVSRIVLDVLNAYGYREREDLAYVQCFDPDETRRLREEFKTRLKLVQLLGDGDGTPGTVDFEQLRTKDGLQSIAEYADGVGPALTHIVRGVDSQGRPAFTELAADAHAAGLVVHAYTLRADALPRFASSFDELLRVFLVDAGVDGVFTDFPDRTVEFPRPSN